jgi:hypothetical protein
VSFSDRSRAFPDGKSPEKDYNGHIPPVKSFFVISYNLIFNCTERKNFPMIPQGISRRVFMVSTSTSVGAAQLPTIVALLISGH